MQSLSLLRSKWRQAPSSLANIYLRLHNTRRYLCTCSHLQSGFVCDHPGELGSPVFRHAVWSSLSPLLTWLPRSEAPCAILDPPIASYRFPFFSGGRTICVVEPHNKPFVAISVSVPASRSVLICINLSWAWNWGCDVNQSAGHGTCSGTCSFPAPSPSPPIPIIPLGSFIRPRDVQRFFPVSAPRANARTKIEIPFACSR